MAPGRPDLGEVGASILTPVRMTRSCTFKKELVRLRHGQRPDARGFDMTNSAGGFEEPLDNQNKKPRDMVHPYLHILSLAPRQQGF